VRIYDAGLKRAAHGLLKIQDAKNGQKIQHLHTIAQLCRAISSQLRHICPPHVLTIWWTSAH